MFWVLPMYHFSSSMGGNLVSWQHYCSNINLWNIVVHHKQIGFADIGYYCTMWQSSLLDIHLWGGHSGISTFQKVLVVVFSVVALALPSPCLSPSSISRLWPHHSSVWHWESLLHLLRPDRSPLHHAGAHRLRPEAHVSSGPCSCQPPPPFGHGASARHRRPLPAAAGSGDFVLLCGAGGRVQRSGDVVVVFGWYLLLFHLSVHHRSGGFCSRESAWAEVQAAVPGGCHGWVLLLCECFHCHSAGQHWSVCLMPSHHAPGHSDCHVCSRLLSVESHSHMKFTVDMLKKILASSRLHMTHSHELLS